MKRREFIALLGAAAATWPMAMAARAQQAVPVIGVLSTSSAEGYDEWVVAIREGAKELGFADGQNVAYEYRWADNYPGRLPALAADLIGRRVDVIVTIGGFGSARAAKAASSSVPIVFVSGTDPVRAGLVASLSRPGGNATGVSLFTSELETKRLELIRELLPNAGLIALLVNPDGPRVALDRPVFETAAHALGQKFIVLEARSESDFDSIFASAQQNRAAALIVSANPLFNSHRDQLTMLAAGYAVPVVYNVREFVTAGGLMSYGTNFPAEYRQLGRYAGRILKGEKPADLPVLRASKFELIVNLKVAKALGLEVPVSILLRADEVIE